MVLLSEPVRRGSRFAPWLALLVVLLALRIALPLVLAPALETRLSRVIGAPVEIGDLSFAPLDAVVTLRDVAVYPPAVTDVPHGARVAPALVAERVRLDVQWLPLVNRALVVREVLIESASVDVGRLAGGQDGLARLVALDPASELPPGWTFALERVALRDTRLRLPADGTLGVRDVAVRDGRLATRQRRASAFKGAPNLRLDALVDGGRVRVDGTSDLRADGVAVDALVRVKDVPLERLAAYLPDAGRSRLRGLVSGQLHYQRDPARRDLLVGRVRVRRVAVHVPTLEEPALAIRRAEAEIDALDLRHRRVAIATLALHGVRLAARTDPADPLPLLEAVPDAAPAASDAPAWSWSVGHVSVPEARVVVAGADGEIVLRASAAGESLGPAAYWSPLRGWVARGDGVAVFDGTARMTRDLTIDGRLTARGVDLPALARALGVPHADLVQAGHVSAELDVELVPGAKDAPPLDARGKVVVHDPWLAAPDPGAFAVGARAIHATLSGIARAPARRASARPPVLRVSDAAVVSPYLLLTRAEEGWLLPPFPEPQPVDDAGEAASGSLASGEAVAGDPAPGDGARGATLAARAHPGGSVASGASGAAREHAPAPAPDAPPAAPEAPAEPRVLLDVASLRTEGGRLLVVDRAAAPTLVADLDVVEGWAEEVRAPVPSVGAFVLQLAGRDLGTLQLASATIDGRREVDVAAQSVPLAATGPWLERAGLPWWPVDGTGSGVARVAVAGDRWTAETTLTLDEARFGGDRAALGRALGMPLEEGLAALRSPDGDVTLRLALAAPDGTGAPGAEQTVARALREAVVRARQAPLPDIPVRLAFHPGRVEIEPGAAREIATLAEVLEKRPDAVVELSSRASGADRRFLAEQAAVAYLEEPGGFLGVLHALGVRDQHARIREALAERAAGRPGRLRRDDELALRELAAATPPVDEHRLAALAAERVARVARALSERHGIARGRVVAAPPAQEESAAPPAVHARFDVPLGTPRTNARAAGERW